MKSHWEIQNIKHLINLDRSNIDDFKDLSNCRKVQVITNVHFYSQLIDDKKNLGEKCNALSPEMKVLEGKYQVKLSYKFIQDSKKNVKLCHSALVKLLKAKQQIEGRKMNR